MSLFLVSEVELSLLSFITFPFQGVISLITSVC